MQGHRPGPIALLLYALRAYVRKLSRSFNVSIQTIASVAMENLQMDLEVRSRARCLVGQDHPDCLWEGMRGTPHSHKNIAF